MIEIDCNPYTMDEKQMVKDKLDNLTINWKIKDNIIIVLDDIDNNTYNYIIDFSRE